MACSAPGMLPEKSFSYRVLVLTVLALAAQLWSARAVTVSLAWNASPDSDVVSYALYYKEAASPNPTKLNLGNTTAGSIAGLAAGKTYTIYATAIDSGGLESPASGVVVCSTPAVTPPVPTPPAGTVSFYRAINVNGLPVIIDGNSWDGQKAPNYVCSGTYFVDAGVPFEPNVDSSHAQMLLTGLYGNDVRLAITSVPNGTYDVYVWSYEDSRPLTGTLSVLGSVVGNFTTGKANSWQRLGPFRVNATQGGIDLRMSVINDMGMLCGAEFWRVQ